MYELKFFITYLQQDSKEMFETQITCALYIISLGLWDYPENRYILSLSGSVP